MAERRDSVERTAALVRRAAALLRGGVSAARVWPAIVAEQPDDPWVMSLATQVTRKLPTSGGGLRSPPEWCVLTAAWHLAEQTGAPVAQVLERFAEALSSLGRMAERRSVLLAGPRATVRLVAALPPVAMLLGALLGFDPVPVLLTPLGAALALVGLALFAIGVHWARLLTRAVERAEWVAGWACELSWICVRGGLSPAAAMRLTAEVADAAEQGAGIDASTSPWVVLTELRRGGAVAKVLDAAAAMGVPAAELLLAEAEAVRLRAQGELERAVERLAVRVLLPLGVCVLPAFVLLGVVPVLIAMLGGVSAGISNG